MFKDQALTVTFSLACSLIVALTLVPLLCSRFLHLESERRRRRTQWTYNLSCKVGLCMEKLDGFYQKVINWALDHRKTVIIAALAIFLVSVFIVWPLRLVGTDFIPEMDQGELLISLEAIAGRADSDERG
jgi:HAE1 family hydrophobic/amphiphilic exporter-1